MSRTIGHMGTVSGHALVIGRAAKPGGPQVNLCVRSGGYETNVYLSRSDALKLVDLLELGAASLEACPECDAYPGNPHAMGCARAPR